MKLLIIIIVILYVTNDIYGLKTFWKGRPKNGYLGDPSKIFANTEHLEIADEWFTQNLDHFNPTNDQTFQQLYFTNDKFYKKDGPVFLMIGGEGPATNKWMTEGAWIKYAEKNNALCFQLEHRFYGKSHPTNDISTENLVYLSSEQALADLVYFIMAMNEKYKLNKNTKWIAFGGSYPGSLAAWLRERYPHLVHGAISSSGPLLAVADFKQYYEVVANSLGTYSDNCVDTVRKSFSEFEMLLKHEIGQKDINEQFKLCHPIQPTVANVLDISNLFESLASNFAGVVQYNKDNSPHATVTIDDVCEIMLNTNIGTPVHRLAQVNSLLMSKQKDKCLDHIYDNMIKDMKEISWESKVADGARQWTYQTCTEFGFYQTSDNDTSVFGNRFSVEFFIKQCIDIFGPRFNVTSLNNAIYRTNAYYGALNPHTTNVLYVHGSIDPWHALGLIKTTDINLPTIYIEGTAHCANMYEPADSDLPQLKEARIKIDQYIMNLLK